MDYRRGFRSLRDEVAVSHLPLDGSLPTWLGGTLVRNGPAQFEVGGAPPDAHAYRHWFDGLAMLHAFALDGAAGTVGYRNRALQTQTRRANEQKGRITRREFATDPCWGLFGRVMSLFRPKLTDNASINVTRLAGEFVALTETPLPVAFDPATLDTLGTRRFEDDLTAPMTVAHPHVEPETGRLVSYLTDFGRTCRYQVVAIDPGTRRRTLLAELPVEEPAYMHSFAMTRRYVVLAEWPLVIDPLSLVKNDRPFIEHYRWEPERGVRFRVVSKQTGAEVATCTADARFAFHHVHAHETTTDGGAAIACDVVTYPDSGIIDALYLDRLRDPAPTPATGTLRRYRLPLTGGPASERVLSPTRLELPRVRPGGATPPRYVYGVGTRVPGNFTDQLVKIDAATGDARTWHARGCYPGEPVFVPAPTSTAADACEDDGVVLSVVLDARAETSFLVVLDAATFTERARATVPHVIPHGFHGQFFGGEG